MHFLASIDAVFATRDSHNSSKHIKSIISYIPIWLKSIAFTLLLLIPMVSIIQLIIELNVSFYPSLPLGVILVGIILLGFYLLLTGRFDKPEFRQINKELIGVIALKGQSLGWIFMSSFSLLVFNFALITIGFALTEEKITAQIRFIQFISEAPKWTAIPLLIVLALSASFVEEILFRGLLQKVLLNHYGFKLSVVLVSIVFVIIHFLPKELMIPYFLASMGFCFLSYYSDSLVPCIIVHFVFNTIMFIVILRSNEEQLVSFIESTVIPNTIFVLASGIFFAFSLYKLKSRSLKPNY